MVTQTTISTIELSQQHLGTSKISEGSPPRLISWRQWKKLNAKILLLQSFERSVFLYVGIILAQ